MLCFVMVMVMVIFITRPSINFSVSLEAVIWDAEDEDVFEYEPVRDSHHNHDDY